MTLLLLLLVSFAWSSPHHHLQQYKDKIIKEDVKRSLAVLSSNEFSVYAKQWGDSSLKITNAWFFGPDVMVVLATGLKMKGNVDLQTILTDEKNNGPIYCSKGTLKSGSIIAQSPLLTQANGVGHVIHSQGDVHISQKDERTKIFLNTNKNSHQQGYAYSVFPEIDVETLQLRKSFPREEILMNSPALQAVRFSKEKIVQMIFHKPGQLKWRSFTLAVDRPALIIFNEESALPKVCFASESPMDKIRIKIVSDGQEMESEKMPDAAHCRPWHSTSSNLTYPGPSLEGL